MFLLRNKASKKKTEPFKYFYHFLDVDNNQEKLIDCSDNSSSEEDEEEEYVEQSDEYNTEEDTESDNEYEDEMETDEDFYLARDKITKWNKTPFSENKTSKSTKKSNITSEPLGDAKGINDELEAFQKIITPSIIDLIVDYTNNTIQKHRSKGHHSRERDLNLTSKNEIMALFGVLYLTGTLKSKEINVREFWNTDGTGLEILRSCMSYKRFMFLLKSLTFDDRKTQKERCKKDRLAKIRTVLDSFIENCKTAYSLGENITVDAILAPFRGKCKFVKYLPNKTARYGLKIFILCDSKTCFVSNIEVYCGTQHKGPYQQPTSAEDVVQRLVQHCEGVNRCITMGNWYTSHNLVKTLHDKRLTCVGAMKYKHRIIPTPFLPQRSRNACTTRFGYQRDMSLVSYTPEVGKPLLLLSSKPSSSLIDKETNKPDLVLHYEATKDAVDSIDQLCNIYSVARRSRRWYVALFFALMNIAGINAQILFMASKKNAKGDRRLFLKNMALKMMEPHLRDRATVKTLPADMVAFLAKYKVEEERASVEVEEKSSKKRGRCETCGRAKNVSTTIRCTSCRKFVCKKHADITAICKKCDEWELQC